MAMTQKKLEIKKDLITYEILLQVVIVRNLWNDEEIEKVRTEIENADNDDYEPNMGQEYIDLAYNDIEDIRNKLDELNDKDLDYDDELSCGLTVAQKMIQYNTMIEYLRILAENMNALL